MSEDGQGSLKGGEKASRTTVGTSVLRRAPRNACNAPVFARHGSREEGAT